MILAIDPSINDLGLALLDDKGNYLDSKLIQPEKEQQQNTTAKLDSLFEQLRSFLGELKDLDLVIIEHTRFFARKQHTSHSSAQKLNLAKGMIYGLCKSMVHCPVHMVWIPNFNKGHAHLLARASQLPKVSQHEMDAFWLGNTWIHCPQTLRQQYLQCKDL